MHVHTDHPRMRTPVTRRSPAECVSWQKRFALVWCCLVAQLESECHRASWYFFSCFALRSLTVLSIVLGKQQLI